MSKDNRNKFKKYKHTTPPNPQEALLSCVVSIVGVSIVGCLLMATLLTLGNMPY